MSLVVGFSENAMHILCTQTIKLFEFVCLLFAIFPIEKHPLSSIRFRCFCCCCWCYSVPSCKVMRLAKTLEKLKVFVSVPYSKIDSPCSIKQSLNVLRERKRKKNHQQTVGWMLWVLTGTMRNFRQTFGFYFAFGFPPFFVNLIVIQAFIGRSLNKQTKFALFCALSWPSTLLNVNSRTTR